MNNHRTIACSSSPRKHRLRSSLLGALGLALMLAMFACDDEETPSPWVINEGPGENNPADRPYSGTLALNESQMVGKVQEDHLLVSFPLEARSDAKGELEVSLRTVDGSNVLASSLVPFDLRSGEKKDQSVSLSIPPDLVGPEDWVRYVVLVEQKVPNGIRVTRSTLTILPAYDVSLEGPSKLQKNKQANYRVRARNVKSQAPLADVPVSLRVGKEGQDPKVYEAKTGATGDAIFELTLDENGPYEIAAQGSAQGTKVEMTSTVPVQEPGGKVLLTTDKPIYQPGQVIHLRALALNQGDNTPIPKQPALFEIEDGKGNKIFKKIVSTDEHGIASSKFAIGPVVNMGTFKVRSTLGELKTEKSVSVSRYVLPKFRVGVQTDKSWYLAGETIQGSLDVNYFFGKPVSGGDVLIEAIALDVGESVLQTFQGKTTADGKLPFSIHLPSMLVGLPINNGNALITLRVTATDTAQQQVKQEKAITVAQSAINISLIPESTSLVYGIENNVDLFATDPLGSPIPNANISLVVDKNKYNGKTDSFGHANFAWTPLSDDSSLVQVNAEAPGGASVATYFSFSAQSGNEHLLVRSDKAVYELGETAKIEIRCSDPSSYVYVDWLNGGQVIDMRTLQAKEGVASFSMPIDISLHGSNRIEAYVVDKVGNIVRAGRTIFTRGKSALQIQLATDKPQYAPGETAKLTFSVTNEDGKPAPAALGVQVVDEAVFSLIDARPGLLRTYFELEDSFSQPSYEVHAPAANIEDLVYNETKDNDPAKAKAAQIKASAIFSALGDKNLTGLSLSSWPQVQMNANAILNPYFKMERDRLFPMLSKIVKEAKEKVEKSGCTVESYYCNSGSETFKGRLIKQLADKIKAVDFWGTNYSFKNSGEWDNSLFSLVSAGPDEEKGTTDDGSIIFTPSDFDISMNWGPPMAGNENDWGVSGSGGAADNENPPSSKGEEGPRIRKDFPETLYVNPALITGSDGKATISIPMADSITSWRVSSLANSMSGKLGGGVSGITVFQDFFADINFPATLTRGDEVTFPVAVYNYLTTPQTVKLQLSTGDWYTPLGPTSLAVTLQPGEVKGVQIPVRVEKVGLHTLTVTAIGSSKSDAVARTVRVIPDGKEIASSQSGSLGAGETTLSVNFPTNAVDGSPHLHLDIYPAFLSQVVSGMDSMLRTPTGCFEQTTSSAWPNVLVTAYMKASGQITPEIQMKAESLMSAGYQRLLTFEHPGGGFSWFGTQDPKPYLSVTAFGLMEFADMAKVHEVDSAMIARTAQWLANQQASDGSWKGDQTEFFSFQTSTLRNTAFVAWALATAGFQPQSANNALTYVKNNWGKESQDLYTIGIVANAFVAAAPNDSFTSQLLSELDSKKVVDGDKIKWPAGDTQTMFYGSGNDAEITSTALAAHAMLSFGGYPSSVSGAIQYLVSSRDAGGNFGSTQATIWTLRTLLLASSKGVEGAVGTVDVTLDGKPFTSVQLTEDQADVLHTVDLSGLVTKGSHDVKLAFVGSGKLSYNLVSKHNIPWAEVIQDPGPISLSVNYDKTSLAVNDTVTATVAVTNNVDTNQDMILVTLGIPPGFGVMSEDFSPYLKENSLSNFEVTGKQLILYINHLDPKQSKEFSYRLQAMMPVKAEDGGGKVHPYYQPDETTSAASTTFFVSAD